MNIYLAPMEGVTGAIYRRALNSNFPGVDKYFTAFISSTKNLNFKQKKDVDPKNNTGMTLVPQFMAHQAERVLDMYHNLIQPYGYQEINLNHGCPSGTVVSKNHGSGFLREPDQVDRFLDQLYSKADFQISVKTRIGVEDPAEWDRILKIYKKYPMKELIIHPRTTRDQYKYPLHPEAFQQAVEEITNIPLCYNGDINTLEDYIGVKEAFPGLENVMIGRGILYNPMLITQIKAYEAGKLSPAEAKNYTPSPEEWKALQNMMQEIRDSFQKDFSGEAHVLAHLKELWGYLQNLFPESKKEIKMLKKSQNLADYDAVVQLLFNKK